MATWPCTIRAAGRITSRTAGVAPRAARERDQALDPSLEAKTIDDHEVRLNQPTRVGSARLVDVGVGIGTIFGNYVAGALRNPAAAAQVFPNVLLGFALTEAIALFALVIAMLQLFVF